MKARRRWAGAGGGGEARVPGGSGRVLAALLLALGWLGPVRLGAAERLDLAGRWRVRLDAADVGIAAGWPARPLDTADRIRLPGTTDLAGLGVPWNRETGRYPVAFPYTRFPGVEEPERGDARGFLVRPWLHLGPAWYERDLDVPARWRGRRLVLRFERVMWRSDVWVDGVAAGSSDSLATPHGFDLGVLDPGRHRLTVRVDNRMIVNLSTITHAYGPETQSRWNGLVGTLDVEALPNTALRRLEIHPAPDRRSVRVRADLDRIDGVVGTGLLTLEVLREDGGAVVGRSKCRITVPPGTSQAEGQVEWENPAEGWDEFRPVRHRVRARLRMDGSADAAGAKSESESEVEAEARFGFRALERDGRELRLNGRRLFLRGTLDCAVYPRTGHPPVTVGAWERVLRRVREYGFNHVRFHTWCPPDAAFEAADRLGLYLAPEVSAWVDDWTRETAGSPPAIGRDPEVNRFLRAEARRIVEAYGNHPSFILLTFGNEFGLQGTDWDEVERWVAEVRARDPRRWVVATTARRSLPDDDAWVTHAVHGRAARGVGGPSTDWDFAAAVAGTPLPVIAHETGQRPVFPDYADLLPKFRGPLRPWNYVRLEERLRASGVSGQTRAFAWASARFQAIQYQAEHEALRRTPGLAGYQLLMLNDFPGQSEALVGILDPFGESKGVIGPDEVRAWNAPTVPLARLARRTWRSAETFGAELQVAHHGASDLPGVRARWDLGPADRGPTLASGETDPRPVPTGSITTLGRIAVPLGAVGVAGEYRLRLRVGDAVNAWSIWVYPPAPEPSPEGWVSTSRFDAAAERALAEGRTVVMLAHGLTHKPAARTGFLSVYWSAGWWGNAFSSLGILCDPRHPALRGFPNRGHSDWPWRELVEGATVFRLDGAPPGFRPVVQAVPDFHHPGLLAHVFEARVGAGRLIVCGYDLDRDLASRPAAEQFRRSLFRHAAEARVRPPCSVPVEIVREWLAPRPGG